MYMIYIIIIYITRFQELLISFRFASFHESRSVFMIGIIIVFEKRSLTKFGLHRKRLLTRLSQGLSKFFIIFNCEFFLHFTYRKYTRHTHTIFSKNQYIPRLCIIFSRITTDLSIQVSYTYIKIDRVKLYTHHPVNMLTYYL